VILGVDKVTLGQVFLRELWLSPDSIISPMLHTHLTTAGFSYQKDKQKKPGKLTRKKGDTKVRTFTCYISQSSNGNCALLPSEKPISF